jgi:hypothetical protein
MSLAASSVIPKGLYNPSRWLSDTLAWRDTTGNRFSLRTTPAGVAHGVTPAGVSFIQISIRWYRPRRAQPPARIVASLRLASWKENFCRDLKLSVAKAEEKV